MAATVDTAKLYGILMEKLGKADSMTIKGAELNAILARAAIRRPVRS